MASPCNKKGFVAYLVYWWHPYPGSSLNTIVKKTNVFGKPIKQAHPFTLQMFLKSPQTCVNDWWHSQMAIPLNWRLARCCETSGKEGFSVEPLVFEEELYPLSQENCQTPAWLEPNWAPNLCHRTVEEGLQLSDNSLTGNQLCCNLLHRGQVHTCIDVLFLMCIQFTTSNVRY